MASEKFAGIFMLVTSLVVVVPVVLQLRSRESDWRYAWAPLLFVLGLATTGSAYVFFTLERQKSVALAGVAAMLLALLLAPRTRKSNSPS